MDCMTDCGSATVRLISPETGKRTGVFDIRRQRTAVAADNLQQQYQWDHPAVAIAKIAEVVVAAHFSAVDRVLFAHPRFDKGVPGFADDRDSAAASYNVQRIPRQARVQNDVTACGALQEVLGEQANQ